MVRRAGRLLLTATGLLPCAAQIGNLTDGSLAYDLNATLGSSNPFITTANNPSSAIAVSTGGGSVYVGGELGGLAIFARDRGTGALTLTQTLSEANFSVALESVEQILISPDGKVLATLGSLGPSSGTLGVFSIDSNGDLSLLQQGEHRGVVRGEFAPDSSQDLYVIDDDQSLLTHYSSRASGDGTFTITQTMGGGSCLHGLSISPDGLSLYAGDDCQHSTKHYRRDAGTGSLSFHDELRGIAGNGDGLGCLKNIAFTSSGEWGVGLDSCDNSLTILSRDTSTGTLAPVEMVIPLNPIGNTINALKAWNVLVASDGFGDAYVADWADKYILWMSLDLQGTENISVSSLSWFSLGFRPSALALSHGLDSLYAANKEGDQWVGALLQRQAAPVVPTPTPTPTPSSSSGGSNTLAISLSASFAVLILAVTVIWYARRKRSRDQYHSEEEKLRLTLEENPNDAVAQNNLGYLKETVHKDLKGAEFHYREALRINPGASFAHNSLGHLLHHGYKNFEGAEEHYRKAIQLHWRSPDAHYNLGCLLQHHKEDMEGAERQYRHAIKCDPKHGMAQYNLGWLLEKVKKNLPAAEKCYQAALEADPEDRDASRRLNKVVDQMRIRGEEKEMAQGELEKGARPQASP